VVRYSFKVRLLHPLLHAGSSRRFLQIRPSADDPFVHLEFRYFYDCPGAPPVPAAAKAAVDAYGSIVAAYSRQDAKAYFEGFADPVKCFYGQAAVTVGDLQRRRGVSPDTENKVESYDIQVLSTSSGEVALEDWGVWGGDGPMRWYDKIIVLRAEAGSWKIASEGGARRDTCPGAAAAPVPERIARCREIDETCENDCAQDPACLGAGGNGCYMCVDECQSSHDACVTWTDTSGAFGD
jgi:hypothetical protein